MGLSAADDVAATLEQGMEEVGFGTVLTIA